MAARFVTDNYIYETGSMTGILAQLKWESLKKKGGEIRHVRNHHSLAFQPPFANTDINKSSFFPPPPQTIRDWNSLTDFLLSAAEGAEDSVAKFTSLARAKD